MTQDLTLAAHHEAGHAVAAIFSRYHNLPGQLIAQTNGHGENAAGLSRRRCSAAGKQPDPRDKDIGKDLAVIACAGFEAEARCAAELGCSADAGASKEDYELARQFVGDEGLKSVKVEAAQLVELHWSKVKQVAAALLGAPQNRIWGADAYDVLGVPIP